MALKVLQIDAAQMTPHYNLAICQGLVEADCNVNYVTTRYLYTELEYPENVNYDLLYFRGIDRKWLMSFPRLRKILRGFYYPFCNVLLLQKVRSSKPDIVHFQWSRLPRLDLPLIRAIQNMGLSVVHTVHDVKPLFESGNVSKLYDIYRQCDGLIVHSEANKQALLEEVPNIDPKKVFVLPLVNAPFTVPVDGSSQTARDLLGIPKDAFVILFFGLIKQYKGLDTLFEAMKLVNQQNNNITWLVVGKTGDKIQQAYLDQINMLDRTFIFSDYVPNEEIWQYHCAADVGVFPYRHIFQSAALITAMSFSLPIIATDIGSFPETVQGNGTLIPKEDPRALADTILEAYNNWDLAKLGQNSLDIINNKHHYKKVGQLLKTIYEDILK